MPIDSFEIERALDRLISEEAGTVFQRLSVGIAKLERPDLIATTRKSDLGADALTPSILSATKPGKKIAVGVSLTSTKDKIISDADSIKSNYGDIDLLEFYVPSNMTQKRIGAVQEEVKKQYGHDLIVHPREDIVQTLLLEKSRNLIESFLRIRDPDPGLDQVEDILRKYAVSCVPTVSRRLFDYGPMIELEFGDEDGKIHSLIEVSELLEHGVSIVITGDPGAGKSVTLFQIGERFLDERESRVPIFVDLPNWFHHGGELIDYLCHRPELLAANLKATDLAKFLSSGRSVFLLNGWNEIESSERESAHRSLLDLANNLPLTSYAISTRPSDDLPSLNIELLELQGVGDNQRRQYINSIMGADGEALSIEIERNLEIHSLSRNPLALSAIVEAFRNTGVVPHSLYEALKSSIETIETSSEHAPALEQGATEGRSFDYMKDLATELTEIGGVILDTSVAYQRIDEVADRLRSEGVKKKSSSSVEIVECLVSHHLLKNLNEGRNVAFSHQLYQEFYAAESICDFLQAVIDAEDAESDETRMKLLRILDSPIWQSTILLAVDALSYRISRGNEEAKECLKLAFDLSVRVDLMFSATILRRAGSEFWPEVRSEFVEYVDAWQQLPDPHPKMAYVARLESGNEEFSKIAWETLCADGQDERRDILLLLPSNLSLDSIRGNWREAFAAFDDETRRRILTNLSHYGDRDTEEALVWFAQEDSVNETRIEALIGLAWNGNYSKVSELITEQSNEVLESLAVKSPLSFVKLSSSAREKLREVSLEILKKEEATIGRFNFLIRTAFRFDINVEKNLKDGLEKFNFDGLPEDRWNRQEALKSIFGYLADRDPDWTVKFLFNIEINGIYGGALELVPSSILANFIEEIFDSAFSPETDERIRRNLIEAIQEIENLEVVVKVLLKWRDQIKEKDNKSEEFQAFLRSLDGYLNGVDPDLLLEAIIQEFQNPDLEDIFNISKLLRTNMRSAGTREKNEKTEKTAEFAAWWGSFHADVLAVDDPEGFFGSEYSNVLSRFGRIADVEIVQKFIAKDIARRNEERRLLEEWREKGGDQPQVSRVAHDEWFVDYLCRLAESDAAEVIIEYLGEPEYEVASMGGIVSVLLAPYRSVEESDLFGRKSAYKLALQAKSGRDPNQIDAEERCANLVRGYIIDRKRNLDDTDLSSVLRLKKVVAIFARVASQEDVDLIFDVICLPEKYSFYPRMAAIENLYSRGIDIDFDLICQVFAEHWDQMKETGRIDESERYTLVNSLTALAYTSTPDRCDSVWREFLPKFHRNDIRQLLTGIIASGSDRGLEYAKEISFGIGDNELISSFLDALIRYGDHDKAAFLLSELIAGDDWELLYRSWNYPHAEGLTSIVSQLIGKDEGIRQSLTALANESPGIRRIWIASILIHSGDIVRRDALQLISSESVGAQSGWAWEAIKNQLLRKESDDDLSSYQLRSEEANALRSELLSIGLNDETKKENILGLLGNIDLLRLEYGKPIDETRHPDRGQNCRWQLIDRSIN